MPVTLEIDDFRHHLGTAFAVRFPDGTVELVLDAVEPHGERAPRPDAPDLRVEPFSLVFLGPARPVLPQRTWELVHAALGTHAVFLVPLGPKGGRMRYEAVFN